MKRVGILTSGGDCQALNATMRGVGKGLYNELGSDVEIYGFEEGYKGLIYNEYRLLDVYKRQAEQSGLDYEDYLRMLLTVVPAKTLAMRSLDVIEGELRMMEGCEQIHLDHCVERMTAQVWMDGIYLERIYGYE